jgi:lipopolysaccharide transport system ATP-binding protein
MVAVSFESVSKRFTLHHDRPRSLQEVFLSTVRGTWREESEDFWVLKDVSFQVAHGETVGLIGANGAGKSTALKLITRIIEPTSGKVRVDGRVGALLELGAGFHPDLTGRENIYLNGSILGLSEARIRSKMGDIIAFAELERFIDVPVKHYSSGMYVRLGFSVAVHTEPEILLVDEVLAVGDYSFQHKCLDRIMEMQQQGVTICYVSHDLGTVERLCSQAIWLDDGVVQASGSVSDTVASYLRSMASQEESRTSAGQASEVKSTGAQRRWGSGDAQILAVSFLDDQGTERGVFRVGEAWAVRIRYRTTRRLEKPVFGLAIHGADGVHICGPNTYFSSLDIPCVDGEGEIVYRVDTLPLLEGTYLVSAAIHNQADTVMYDYHDRLYTFRVRQVEKGERYGLVSMAGRWEWNGNPQS